ncbi:DNA replication complex GINS protein PSF3 [Holothuria leucospilota]|uniref:DNA replication complex GINS protein PSF3 n=1 Tax=Holothuria leucospilota TaxID=206669 RepID=A0A9Q1HDK5_HOLLE|nr:DNA replication complex GINS protein PSF3 [Holothuria leucospilota]
MPKYPYTRYHDETQNYYNIDDIIASQEKVPCTCEVTLHRLGFLNPSNEGDDIIPGTKLDLPLWLAGGLGLHGRRRNIVSVDLPKVYKSNMREILSADANVVDMRKTSPHFYAFGTKLLNFQHEESADVSKMLLEVHTKDFKMEPTAIVLGADCSA